MPGASVFVNVLPGVLHPQHRIRMYSEDFKAFSERRQKKKENTPNPTWKGLSDGLVFTAVGAQQEKKSFKISLCTYGGGGFPPARFTKLTY